VTRAFNVALRPVIYKITVSNLSLQSNPASSDAILSYLSNKFSSINMFHECKLYMRSQMSDRSFVSVYHVYSVSTDNILMWVCEV
jgi:NADH:ubiquinone oxidoreductase subunit C